MIFWDNSWEKSKGIYNLRYSHFVWPFSVIDYSIMPYNFLRSLPWQESLQAWKLWTAGRSLDLVDPAQRDEPRIAEILRCIQIALLCVEPREEDRPTMRDVILMLSSDSLRIPSPKRRDHATVFNREKQQGESWIQMLMKLVLQSITKWWCFWFTWTIVRLWLIKTLCIIFSVDNHNQLSDNFANITISEHCQQRIRNFVTSLAYISRDTYGILCWWKITLLKFRNTVFSKENTEEASEVFVWPEPWRFSIFPAQACLLFSFSFLVWNQITTSNYVLPVQNS